MPVILRRLRLDPEPGALPRVEAADQRARARPAAAQQIARDAGTRRVVRTGAVEHERCVGWQTERTYVGDRAVGRQAKRTARLLVARLPARLLAHIDRD